MLTRRHALFAGAAAIAVLAAGRWMRPHSAAANAFGWEKRDPRPGAMRDGDWLIGWGCATAAYPAQIAPATCRVTLTPQGRVAVQTGTHDIGTGAYTVIAQTAADLLGVSMQDVTVCIGHSDLPAAPLTAGSSGAASVCTVVAQACDSLRARLGQDGKPAADIAAAMKDRGMGALEDYAESIPHGVAKDGVQALYKGAAMPMGEHARSWGVSRRELRNVIVMAHPESWVAPLE